MRHVISDSLSDIITKRTDLFSNASKSPLVVVIDEARVAAEYLKFFRPALWAERRPILRDIVDFFRSPDLQENYSFGNWSVDGNGDHCSGFFVRKRGGKRKTGSLH